MTGLDLVLAILIILQGYIGHRRGIVCELFDVITLLVASAIGLHLFIPLGRALQSPTGWSDYVVFWFAFLLVTLPLGLMVLLLGMHLDRVTRDGEKLPLPLMEWSGAVFGFFKSFLFCWLILMLIKASPLYNASSQQEFAHAPVVGIVRETGGQVGIAMFQLIAPERARNLVLPFLQQGF